MADRDHVDVLFRELDAEFPKFRFVYKDESRLMRVIDVLLRVLTLGMMRTFMTRFTTVIGYTMYVARKSWYDLAPDAKAIIVRHERVHMRQRTKYGMLLFSVLYLLLPLPGGLSYFRAKFEKEAYEESIRAAVEYGWDPMDPMFRENIVSTFLGPPYFWSWPFRWNIESWYDSVLASLKK